MIGRRIYPADRDKVFHTMEAGDYFKLSTGEFIIKTPNGMVASIRNHRVTGLGTDFLKKEYGGKSK